jgi:hypothetical protein
MSFKNYLVIFFWACIPVVASANYFSTECSYCTDSGYKQAAVNAVPFPPGGNVSGFTGYPHQLGSTVHTQGDGGEDDLVCDWSCSGDTCTLSCAPATE